MKRIIVFLLAVCFIFQFLGGRKNVFSYDLYGKTYNVPFSSEYIVPIEVRYGVESKVCLFVSEHHLITGDFQSKDMSYVLTLPDYIEAPVEKGQSVGMVSYYIEDILIYQSDLCIEKSIERKSFGRIIQKMFVRMLK